MHFVNDSPQKIIVRSFLVAPENCSDYEREKEKTFSRESVFLWLYVAWQRMFFDHIEIVWTENRRRTNK